MSFVLLLQTNNHSFHIPFCKLIPSVLELKVTFKICLKIKDLLIFQYKFYLYLSLLLPLIFCALYISLILLNSRARHLKYLLYWDRESTYLRKHMATFFLL
jgi:hypothetical protein